MYFLLTILCFLVQSMIYDALLLNIKLKQKKHTLYNKIVGQMLLSTDLLLKTTK